MDDPFLWFIDYHGSLYKYALKRKEWTRVGRPSKNSRKDTFKRISSTSKCAWAIGGDQKVYVAVNKTDLPIRVCESTYENQRWSLSHRWSEKSLLFTDRWSWSSKDGKEERSKAKIKLPSEFWMWEDEWFVDMSTNCDIEGWQYAFDFPATFYNAPGRLTFVKRRKWSRYRVFKSFNQWMEVPCITNEDPFQDITIGGDQIVGQVQGFLCVWAITFCGKVIFRSGVSRTCPKGVSWANIPADDLNLVQISVGPSGLLWGCTWDGSSVVRKGITPFNPTGTAWCVIKRPSSDIPIFQVSVGSKALWAIGKDSKVFFRRNIVKANNNNNNNLENHDNKDSWVEMYGSFLFITVGPNEQVWAIGKDDRQLYMRTHVTSDELVGREWKLLKLNRKSKHALECYWIDSGACDVDSTYFKKDTLVSRHSNNNLTTDISATTWRCKILWSLLDRNKTEKCNQKGYIDATQDNATMNWSNRIQCFMLIETTHKVWCKCHMKYMMGSENNQPMLVVYYSRKEEFEELTFYVGTFVCVHHLKYSTKPYTLAIQMQHKSDETQLLIFSMDSEKIMNEWMTSLAVTGRQTENMVGTILWVTSQLGDLFYALNDGSKISNYNELRWVHVNGHMKQIVAGIKHITWAVGYDGVAYTYDPVQMHVQQSVEEHVIFQNQRWNPVEGYTDRLLPSDRWAWSDVSGAYNQSKENYSLSTCTSKWISDWSIYQDNQTDEEGWQYAVDFPRHYHKKRSIKDYVRRRRWRRLAKVTSEGPWAEIKSDVKLVDVSVSMDDNAHSIVWAVSCNGDVMVRTGVTSEIPQGVSWCYVPTDIPVTSVSVGVKSRVWCVGIDGSCFLRAEISVEFPEGKSWFHVLKNEYLIRQISVGRNVVLGLDQYGCLLQRCHVTDAYPEGTAWLSLFENVSSVSVNAFDQICFVHDHQVTICEMDLDGNFRANHTLLLDGWDTVCCRSVISKDIGNVTDKLENFTLAIDNPDETDHGISNDIETDDGVADSFKRIDPYTVDIYSFYNTPNEEK